MNRLIVKNFGPLKDIDININRINLFIGDNGSGKSVLAKLITIITDSDIDTTKSYLDFKQDLSKFNIDFLQKDTVIKFYTKENQEIFLFENETLYCEPFDIDLITDDDEDKVKELLQLSKVDPFDMIRKQGLNSALNNLLLKIDYFSSKYIPAERNLISIFNKSLSSLLVADIPLPKFLLQFSSEYEKARDKIKELEFLNVKYVNSNRDKIFYNNSDYLDLEHSSSGIQSALPLYLTVKYFAKRYRNIIIEEPEQNLFPKSQDETVKFISKQVSRDNNLFMMTHSPYILSTLNNLIFAFKVSRLNREAKEETKKIIDEDMWIDPKYFTAYSLKDGKAINIVSKRGLISDNEIDDISETVADEFDTLMEIYREFKNVN